MLKRLHLVISDRGSVWWGWLVVLIIVIVGAFAAMKLLPRASSPESSRVVARGKIPSIPAPKSLSQAKVPQIPAAVGTEPAPLKHDDAPSSASDVQSSRTPIPSESDDFPDTFQTELTQASEKSDAHPSIVSDDETPEVDPEKKAPFAIQVGAYHNRVFAENMTSKLKGLGYPAFIFELKKRDKRSLYMVRFGRFGSRAAATRSAADFKEKEKMPALVVISKSR